MSQKGMLMEIIETNLSFRGMSSRSVTRRIILHHAEAVDCTAADIHAWHKDRGWAGAGYHFLVRKDGKVYRLRPEWAVGAHAAGANSDSIGICFEGAFNVETMGQAQIQTGRELVSYLKGKYSISLVQRHKDVGQTDCPGNNFPFSEIAVGTSGSKPTTTVTETTTTGGNVYMFGVREIGNGDYGNDVLLAQEILGSRGYYTGELDKGFGPLMVAATKRYQSDRKGACGAADGIIGAKTWQDMIAL